MNAEINRMVADPQFARDKFYPLGLQPPGSTPRRFREVMEADIASYARIAQSTPT